MADPVTYNQPTGTAANGQQIYTSGITPTVNSMPTPTPPVSTPTPSPTDTAPTTGTTTPTATTGTTTPSTTQGTTTTTGTGTLTMPQNGSVVDLLNQAGTDSSYASRTQLASQLGIQGYSGTAAQNQELSKKYLDFYNTKKGTVAPDSNPRQEISDAMSQSSQPDPQKSFFDSYLSLNPVVKNLYDTISNTLSSIGTQQTFTQQYQDLVKSQGIEGLQTDLMNINNIMDGTEDDIRTEIQKAGGFATESQVQALTGARNKTLLKQANVLAQQLQAKEDYINQVMQFSKADREEVDKQIDQKLGLTQQLADMQTKITDAAKDNFNQIIKTQGYGGLYASLQGDPGQISQVEILLGLGKGGLKNLASYVAPLSEEDKLRNQNLKLQNQKLSQDLSGGADLQFISGTANQPAGTFNKATGKFTPLSTNGGGNELQMATTKNSIDEVHNLLTSPGLAGAVGPNVLARSAPDFDFFTGVRGNFIAGVQQLTSQLTLDKLYQAKANGATFGSLTEGERSEVANAATKIGTWAIKDSNGNVKGYNTTETAFKAELEKLNNFSKLDYVLKGGNPADVGVQEMTDGTLWVQNNNGTYTEIR